MTTGSSELEDGSSHLLKGGKGNRHFSGTRSYSSSSAAAEKSTQSTTAASSIVTSTMDDKAASTVKTKIPCEVLYNKLQELGVDFYAGVPDSLLKDFCAYVTDNCSAEKHIICANEGTAVGTATGYHLASGKVPIVYMQNSGFGNIINPVLSLASPEVYKIPMILLVGWRGEPGVKDEPQHNVMGRLQEQLLKACEIPYAVLPQRYDPSDSSSLERNSELDMVLQMAVDTAKKTQGPFALLVKKNTFESYKLSKETQDSIKTVPLDNGATLSREQCLEVLIRAGSGSAPSVTLEKDAASPTTPEALLGGFLLNKPVVSTTGVLSRELYELREALGLPSGQDFLCVGSMGHAGAIAHGVACAPAPPGAPPSVVLDGDGGCLMHLGQLAVNGACAAAGANRRKLVHILINNGLHESVGGQPTAGLTIDSFAEMAKACKYSWVRRVRTREEIEAACEEIASICDSDVGTIGETGESADAGETPSFFLEILVKPGVKPNLGRPKSTPEENKLAFVKTHFGL